MRKIVSRRFCLMMKQRNKSEIEVINPHTKSIDLNPYSTFFKELATSNFENFTRGNFSFDPNISDQLCHLRALFWSHINLKYDGVKTMPEDVLELVGKGMLLTQATPFTLNEFGMMDKWIDLSRNEFEKIIGHKFSNNQKVKFLANLKSNFSININKYIFENYIKYFNQLSYENHLPFHFSNMIYFVQKHHKIPFVPFFSSGHCFVKILQTSEIKVALLYRQYIINEDNDIFLNGIKYLPVVNDEIQLDCDFSKDNENYVVIECFSCHFVQEPSKYSLKFYKEPEFENIFFNMKEEFEFKKIILAGFGAHDKFHQPLFVDLKEGPKEYDNDDFEDEYLSLIENYRQEAFKLGAGNVKWNPSKQIFLEEDIAFNVFHIYPKHSSSFASDIQKNKQYLFKKFPLKKKFNNSEIPKDVVVF